MKKALIIYAIIFAVTIIIPALICFTDTGENSGSDLVGIFGYCSILPVYYH